MTYATTPMAMHSPNHWEKLARNPACALMARLAYTYDPPARGIALPSAA